MESGSRFPRRPRIRRAMVLLYVIGLFSLFAYALYILHPHFSDQGVGPLYEMARSIRSAVPVLGLGVLLFLIPLGTGFLDRQLNRVTVVLLLLNLTLILFFLLVFWGPGVR